MYNKNVNISFIGGYKNGEILENFPVNKLPPRFYFPSDTYFTEDKSGGMSIYKGKLNQHWHSYSASIYERTVDSNEPETTINYTFVEEGIIDRCSALTTKKVRCMKPAVYEKPCCLIHNK
jgi:hypothetical protein